MLLTVCQNTFQSMVELEEVDSLRVEVRECYAEITRTSEQIQRSDHDPAGFPDSHHAGSIGDPHGLHDPDQ